MHFDFPNGRKTLRVYHQMFQIISHRREQSLYTTFLENGPKIGSKKSLCVHDKLLKQDALDSYELFKTNLLFAFCLQAILWTFTILSNIFGIFFALSAFTLFLFTSESLYLFCYNENKRFLREKLFQLHLNKHLTFYFYGNFYAVSFPFCLFDRN
jgi:hypothetical protein